MNDGRYPLSVIRYRHPLSPRAVASLFDLAAANSGTSKTTVSCYMVELYNDKLVDLFFRVDAKSKRAEGPKLDIKVDKKVRCMAACCCWRYC